MSVLTATTMELLRLAPVGARAEAMFSALAREASRQGEVAITPTTAYAGGSEWLMVWGYGGPAREPVIARHLAAGGRVIIWDLAYWDRDRKVRVSIDGPHPTAHLMAPLRSLDRFQSDRTAQAEHAWRAKGPVMIAGIGDKARAYYGATRVDQWEAAMAAEIRARWPQRPVIYRRKTVHSPIPAWAVSVSCGSPIAAALRNVSLVVTWHSNVAVDAIRMGIPVVCQDGAAAAVCPAALPDEPTPLPADVRDRFLGQLAWWQWAPGEAADCWRFLREVLA